MLFGSTLMVDFVDSGSMGFRYFIFELGGGFIRDSTNDKILGFEEICNRLNEQQDTIKRNEQTIAILQQEMEDAQKLCDILSDKLKGWNNV